MKLRRRHRQRLKYAGYGVGALGVAVIVSVAIIGAVQGQAPDPVSDQVSSYYEANKGLPTSEDTSTEVIAFIGDSYTQGAGASSTSTNWVSLVAGSGDIRAVNLGRGGTGYVSTAGVNGCGLEFCPSYPAMVAKVVAANPSTVVISGGQNDFGSFARDPAAVTDAINTTFDGVRAGLPDARILAVGPSTPRGVNPNVVAFDAAVQSAASSVGAGYVSLIDPDVVDPQMVKDDGSHVNDEGHAAIAERVILALR